MSRAIQNVMKIKPGKKTIVFNNIVMSCNLLFNISPKQDCYAEFTAKYRRKNTK